MGCQNGKDQSKKIQNIKDLVQNLNTLQNKIFRYNNMYTKTNNSQIDQQVLSVIKYINNYQSNITSTTMNADTNKQLQEYMSQMKQYQMSAKTYLISALKYIEAYSETYSQNILFINLNQQVQKFYNFTFCLELSIQTDNSKKGTIDELGDLCQSEIIC